MNNSPDKKNIRVLIAKPGLDGHDRGAKVILHTLKEAGMEVFYTGLHNTIEEIVDAASEKDVDVIGLSIYSGAHLPLSNKLIDLLKQKGLENKLVMIGGNIPHNDIETLKKYGIKGVFPTGSDLNEIITFIRKNIEA